MTPKFTPGPWSPHRALFFADDGRAGWDIYGPQEVGGRGLTYFTEDDARLIAAAPELYTVADHPVLEWLVTEGLAYLPEVYRTTVESFLIPLRNAALAKARGEATTP